ncbi:hypothetical protein RVR_4404 [Actinacidiphila reveromycinica]|uniref:HNH endonuclease n=1 Tax=Actinacidiphila reveromycinica TaxID=659352 RepID=A0A7U3VP33_9ACTN|nr:hypothetical protein [Streptomyces sp. SN-593]BBA98274.1 hypothetical protein RVR_4404 [Streptomyces sp. SN-593]
MTADEIAAALDDASGAVEPGPSAARARQPSGRGEPATSWADAFAARTVAVEGGHLHWTGATGHRGTPVVSFRGQVETGYRLAFRWHHGREPEGNVRPRCDYPGCVAGGHLADRKLREGGGS